MTLKQHNKGYTLVELIVVIAIVGILAGALSTSPALVSTSRARKAAQAVDDMLSQCKVLTLSGAQTPKVTLLLDGDTYYARLSLGAKQHSKETLGGAALALSYTQGGTVKALADGTPLTLSFNPTTGALEPKNCTAISVGSYTVTLTPATGYHAVGR